MANPFLREQADGQAGHSSIIHLNLTKAANYKAARKGAPIIGTYAEGRAEATLKYVSGRPAVLFFYVFEIFCSRKIQIIFLPHKKITGKTDFVAARLVPIAATCWTGNRSFF